MMIHRHTSWPFDTSPSRVGVLAAVVFEAGHEYFDLFGFSSLINATRNRTALHRLNLWTSELPTDAEFHAAVGPNGLDLPSVRHAGDIFFEFFHLDSSFEERALASRELAALSAEEIELLINLLPPDEA